MPMTDTRALIDRLHNARWRELLLSQFDTGMDEFARHQALYQPLSAAEKMGHLNSELAPDAHDCELLMRIGLIGEFPTREPWPEVGVEVINWFWTLRHPSFASAIEQHYEQAAPWQRSSALVVLCCQETPAATDLMVRLLKVHGLTGYMQPRFFWELNKRHAALAPRLFPELLLHAGPELADVMNYLNVGLEGKHVSADALRPAADWNTAELMRLLALVEPLQKSRGMQWRADEDYSHLRSRVGVHLDLLGIIPDTPIEPLERAARLKDPRLILFALISMLKKGMSLPGEALESCARSHETRAELYRQLKHQGRLELFPQQFLTFEAFAAAAMTEWLLYPAELGYEPAVLELVAQAEGVKDGEPGVMCLWKFTNEEGTTFAAASGPYPVSRPAEPLFGQDTFSNFTQWQSLTPEQHLEEILGTLSEWKIAWCRLS
jgi:hypothetical protein